MMDSDIATRELRKPIDVAEYLFRRLREVGIRSVHGVPGKDRLGTAIRYIRPLTRHFLGDYNLASLDYLPKCDLHWVGNCNELNAGTYNIPRYRFLQLRTKCPRQYYY